MIVNDELGRNLKETVLGYFKVQSQHLSWATERNWKTY